MTSTGHIDGSETEVEAAVRELKEETGLTLAEEDLTELARVRPDTHPIRVSDDIEENEVLVLFGAKAPEGWSPSVKDGDGEADNFRWVPVSSYLKMVNRTVNELVQNGGRVGDADLTNIDMQITPHGTNYADELARAATYSAVFHDINQADRANYPDAYNW